MLIRSSARRSRSGLRSCPLYVGVENLFDFTQPHPIVASSDPWRDDFDATMVWGPVYGRKIYGGLRWNI